MGLNPLGGESGKEQTPKASGGQLGIHHPKSGVFYSHLVQTGGHKARPYKSTWTPSVGVDPHPLIAMTL